MQVLEREKERVYAHVRADQRGSADAVPVHHSSRKLEEAGDLQTFVGNYVTGGYGRTVERYRCETEVTKS